MASAQNGAACMNQELPTTWLSSVFSEKKNHSRLHLIAKPQWSGCGGAHSGPQAVHPPCKLGTPRPLNHSQQPGRGRLWFKSMVSPEADMCTQIARDLDTS